MPEISVGLVIAGDAKNDRCSPPVDGSASGAWLP